MERRYTAKFKDMDPRNIMNSLRDSQTLSKVKYFLTQKGIPTTHPTLKIEINTIYDQQILELEAEDVNKIFSTFGPIESVTVSPTHKNSAVIVFKDIVSAYFAQQSLHMHQLPAYQARLSVKWVIDDNPRFNPTTITNPTSALENIYPPSSDSNSNTNCKSTSNGKYTCRFEIQIENDKEFQVARRLIGPKGIHMKRIIEICSKGCTGPVQEVIKLRLRGRGSGFKEGPTQQESEEALHLCISSPYMDRYLTACEMCKELIRKVYDEYSIYCEEKGKYKVQLEIKMMENVNPMPIKSNKIPPTTYGKPDYMGYDEAGYQIRPMSVPYYPGMVGRPRVPYYYPQIGRAHV